MNRTIVPITRHNTYRVAPGDTFDLLLPDGSILNVEQTADDFSIWQDDRAVFTKATSPLAKAIDGEA